MTSAWLLKVRKEGSLFICLALWFCFSLIFFAYRFCRHRKTVKYDNFWSFSTCYSMITRGELLRDWLNRSRYFLSLFPKDKIIHIRWTFCKRLDRSSSGCLCLNFWNFFVIKTCLARNMVGSWSGILRSRQQVLWCLRNFFLCFREIKRSTSTILVLECIRATGDRYGQGMSRQIVSKSNRTAVFIVLGTPSYTREDGIRFETVTSDGLLTEKCRRVSSTRCKQSCNERKILP